MNKVYAIFFRLPFEQKIYCVYARKNNISLIQNPAFGADDHLICLNFDDFSSSQKSALRLPGSIFDLNLARKRLIGLPKRFFNDQNPPWNGVSCLGRLMKPALFAQIREIEQGKQGSYASWLAALPGNWAELLIKALKREYRSARSELQKLGMLREFTGVDMKLRLVFARSGIEGIVVDETKLAERYEQLDKAYYQAVLKLESSTKYTVGPSNAQVNYDSIAKYIPNLSPEDFPKRYFWDSVELFAASDEFLSHLNTVNRCKRDMNELLSIKASIGKNIRMNFDLMGTVSGRIMITYPGIQHLRKTSRDIFSPATGAKFLYPDFRQFEPGIMAHISGDKALAKICNSGDVYTDFAEKLGFPQERKFAKLVFLRYMYGMQMDSIRRVVARKLGNQAATKAFKYFQKFRILNSWRDKMGEKCRKDNQILENCGYIRRRGQNESDQDIQRWSSNHVVQSTASKIFKKSLCSIVENFPEARLVVPMHDAILLEVPTERFTMVRKGVEEIMVKVFQEECPMIKGRVNFKAFAS